MKILFLLNSFNVGGYEQLMLEVFGRLREEGADITTVCLKEEGKLAGELVKLGIPVLPGFIRGKYDLFAPARIARTLRGSKFDLLFLEMGRNSLLVGEYLGRALGIRRRISSIHSTGLAGGGKLLRRGQRTLLNRLDGIITCARTQREYLIRDEGLSADQLTAIVNGVDHQKFRPLSYSELPDTPGAPEPGEKTIATIASLWPEKGHINFVDAAAVALREIPDARFFILGDGPERGRIEEHIRGLGLESRIILMGIRRDLPTLLPRFTATALASYPQRETLPISTMEGMACGLPAVNTDVGSVRDLVVDGENGFVVPHSDPEALGQGFIRMLGDLERVSRMGRAARKRVEEQFTLSRAVREYSEYFRRISAVDAI